MTVNVNTRWIVGFVVALGVAVGGWYVTSEYRRMSTAARNADIISRWLTFSPAPTIKGFTRADVLNCLLPAQEVKPDPAKLADCKTFLVDFTNRLEAAKQ